MVAAALRFRRNNAFSTTFWDRRFSAMWRGLPERPPGTVPTPTTLVFASQPDTVPSSRPPVRIFLGSESAQQRAERVFVWSILKVRDPSRCYEIHLMKDLVGFNRRRWKTGFTNYRYAIPSLAAGLGRAIYNDVDQIYLADPAELFDTDMGGKAMLSIDERETSVMLLDCAKLAELWPRSEAQTITSHRHFREKITSQGLWGKMSPYWNSRDHEYASGRTKLLHFTILHKQPWQPFPAELRYRRHELGSLWLALEQEADAARFGLSQATLGEPPSDTGPAGSSMPAGAR